MGKVLWESSNSLEYKARIVEFEGDKHLEVIIPKKSFLKRLQLGLTYIFTGCPVYLTYLVDKDI